MKKIFFALAALVLAFTGCSQEEDAIQVSEKKAIKVVVNMDKPGFGEDTRAARTGWEDGDQVIVALFNDSEIYESGYIKLIYNVTDDIGAWTTEFWETRGKTSPPVFINNLYDKFVVEGDVKAAYFSSGISSLAFEAPNPSTNFNPAMVITTNAYLDEMGECVMTCEDGTYSFADDVLTLNITMKPQVAQFTIRDLNKADGWNISMGEMSPINMYAGGTITAEGVDLELIDWRTHNAYNHKNAEGISFYAAPWQSNEDIPSALWDMLSPEEQADDEFYSTRTSYSFTVQDGGENWFVRTIGYKEVEIGDAVIMDGPYTDGAESKWGTPE